MRYPLVSIVTPCYNGKKYLDRFFNSILSQTYHNIELIFINDGSTDDTETIAKKYSEIFKSRGINFIYKYQKNNGQASALNLGLKFISGEYFNCLDSDDEISNNFIEEKVKFLEKNTDIAYCYGKAIAINEENHQEILQIYEKRIIETNDKLTFFKDVIYSRNIFFPGYMFRTSQFDNVVPNREIYTGQGGQNAQLLLPMSWYYGEPGYIESAVYFYYVRKDSHSHSCDTYEKIIKQHENYERILINTIGRIQEHCARKYISELKKYYAKIKFGNALCTKDKQLLKKYYKQLKKRKCLSIKDFLLYIKYTNDLFFLLRNDS